MTPDRLRARLDEYFSREGTRLLSPPVALTGGYAGGVYTFALQHAEMVLKTYTPNARGREHATREWRALTRLREQGYPVPHVRHFEPEARHIGRPFIVMDHIPSTSLWHAFEAAGPARRAQLVQLFVAQLVELHALDPQILDPPTHPHSYIEHELEQLRLDGAHSPHTGLAEVVRWLEQRKHAVPCERPAILHRDYHPWNVLVDEAGRPWVIDWDWRIGDVRFDLAWTCMLMWRSDFGEFGRAVRDEYARQSDRPIDDLEYFEVLTTVRWLLNVLPSAEANTLLDDAARADFRTFLVGPVSRAQAFLEDRTGIGVRLSH